MWATHQRRPVLTHVTHINTLHLYVYILTNILHIGLVVRGRVAGSAQTWTRVPVRWSLVANIKAFVHQVLYTTATSAMFGDMWHAVTHQHRTERRKNHKKEKHKTKLFTILDGKTIHAQRRDRTADLTITAMRAIIVTCNSRMLYQLS